MLYLPSATYGTQPGAWDWAKPFKALRRGVEVDSRFTDRPPHTRVVHLNEVTLGDALERANVEGPEDEWVFTLVDWQGEQSLWVGTGLQARHGPGGRVASGGQKVLSLTVWCKQFGTRTKRPRRPRAGRGPRATREGTPDQPEVSEESTPSEDVPRREDIIRRRGVTERPLGSSEEEEEGGDSPELRPNRRLALCTQDEENVHQGDGEKAKYEVAERHAAALKEVVMEHGCTQPGGPNRAGLCSAIDFNLARVREVFKGKRKKRM